MSQNIAEVIGVISIALSVDPSTLRATTESLDVPAWDSLGHLRVCLALEERFGITVDMDSMAELTSVASMAEFVDSHR